jgi:hypothetical protein
MLSEKMNEKLLRVGIVRVLGLVAFGVGCSCLPASAQTAVSTQAAATDNADTGGLSPSTTSTGYSPSGSAIAISPSGTEPAPPLTGADNTLTPETAINPGTSSSFGNSKLPFHITASLGEVYDDNIYIQPHKVSDEITNISVRAEARFGDGQASDSNYFDASYQPSYLVYAEHSHDDALDHNVDVYYQHRFTRLTLSLEQTFNRDQSTDAAVGNLSTANIFNTLAKADYLYSDRLDLTAAFSENVTNYVTAGYTSSDESVGDLYFLYKYDPKLSIGIGPRFGFLDVQEAPNQTYQQLLVRVNYDYSGKLSFKMAAGGEYREYEGNAHGDTLSPVFELSGTYMPDPSTILTLAGSRHYVPSYDFFGQDYISTSVTLSASQRFFQKFYLKLAVGYENDEYQFDAQGLTGPSREDDYVFVNPGLDWRPNGWLVASAFYRFQTDMSSFAAYTFNDNQVGVSLSVSY